MMSRQERINKRLYRRSLKAQSVYAVVRYAKWCVVEYKFANRFEWDERTHEWVPLVYHYTDMNGTCDVWSIRKLTNTTTGAIYNFTFNRDRAEAMVYQHNLLEDMNYGQSTKH